MKIKLFNDRSDINYENVKVTKPFSNGWRQSDMEKVYLVGMVIGNLDLSFEIENQMDNLPGYSEYVVHLLPKDKREQINAFEEKVIMDLHDFSATLFEEDQKWFENISENLKESRLNGEGIPKVIMPPKVYEKFLPKFNEYKIQYNEIKRNIISEYDEIVETFKKGINESFPNAKGILEAIPTKEDYEKICQISIHKMETNV